MMPSNRKKQALWTLCERFIREQRITCPEAVAQSDHVIENAYEFIEQVCGIVGYVPTDDVVAVKPKTEPLKPKTEPLPNCTCHVSLWQSVCLPGCPRGTKTGKMYPTWDDVPDDVLTDERYEARHGRLPPVCGGCNRRVYDADQGKCPLCAIKAQREAEARGGEE